MDKNGTIIENCQISDVPDIFRFFNDFEEYLEKSINLKRHSIQFKTSRFSDDLIQNKFQCHFLKPQIDGDRVGIIIYSTCVLAGVGPILLLMLIYVKEQNKGFGKTLLLHAIQEAEKQIQGEIKQVHFLCNTGNDSAWEFYKRFNARNLSNDTGFIVCQFGLTSVVSDHGNKNVTVRAARESDLPQIVQLFKELRETYSVPVWREEDIQGSSTSLLDNVYVAEDVNSEILGMVSFYYRYGAMTNYTPVIVGFLVKDGHRRCGIGTALMSHLGQMCLKHPGCKSANVFLPPDASSPSRHFFARLPDFVDRSEDDTWNYCLFDRPTH